MYFIIECVCVEAINSDCVCVYAFIFYYGENIEMHSTIQCAVLCTLLFECWGCKSIPCSSQCGGGRTGRDMCWFWLCIHTLVCAVLARNKMRPIGITLFI